MKHVLLIVHTKIFFPRMLEFGHLISKSSNFKPIFHFAYKTSWNNINDEIKVLKDQNFQISNNTRRFEARQTNSNKCEQSKSVPSFTGKLKNFIKAKLGLSFYSLISEFKCRLLYENFFVSFFKIRKRLAQVKELLQEELADIVIITSDVPSWDTGVFIRASRLEQIPTVVALSQTGPLDEAINVFSRKWYLSTTLPLNFILGKVYGKWVNQKNGKKFLMMVSGKTLARELLDVTMPQPWIESSSNADAVLIENEAYYQRGIQVGLQAENLHITGYPFHDVLYSGLSKPHECLNKIYSVHGLDPGKPILLTSLLPNYEGRDSSESDFPDYWDMVRFWIQSLVKYKEYHTIVTLHPSKQRSDFFHIEDMGATIARLSVPEIMPACHAYIASLSSTITMAIACGKPVINYDYAHYRNTHYSDVSGVIHVESKDEFIGTLDKLLLNPEYYAAVASAQSKDARRWGNVDGNAGKRILGVFDQLIDKYETTKAGTRS